MVRNIAICLLLLTLPAGGNLALGQEETIPAPQLYELMIDGESYLVEADRQMRLESKEKPGTKYTVALRISLQQPLELNTLRLEYDWPAHIQDDRGRAQRTVRVRPELGYTFLITDLGQPLESKAQSQALEILVQSVSKSLAESKMQEIEVAKPHGRDFAGSKGQGVIIRYKDKEDFVHNCLVYVLVGEKFAASSIVQFFENNAETVKPRIKAMLDSVRSLR